MTVGEWLETWPAVVHHDGHRWALIESSEIRGVCTMRLRRVEFGRPYLRDTHAPRGFFGLPMSEVVTPELVYDVSLHLGASDDATPFMPSEP